MAAVDVFICQLAFQGGNWAAVGATIKAAKSAARARLRGAGDGIAAVCWMVCQVACCAGESRFTARAC